MLVRFTDGSIRNNIFTLKGRCKVCVHPIIPTPNHYDLTKLKCYSNDVLCLFTLLVICLPVVKYFLIK